MSAPMAFGNNCIIPDGARIESGVTLGQRVMLAGDNIVVRANARRDPACVIAEGVTIGQGAWVRAGVVVTKSVPDGAIVVGNPARIVRFVTPNDRRINPDKGIQ